MEKKDKDKIKYLINKKKSPKEICSIMDITLVKLKEAIEEIKEDGGRYTMMGDTPIKIKGTNPEELLKLPPSESDSYCIVSDLHLGSIYDRPDILRKIYEECSRRGIDTILCAGDVTDGYYPDRKRYCATQRVKGFNEYADYVANTIPYYGGITMYAISGNHDDTLMCQSESILNRISHFRKDFKFLGTDVAELTIDDERIKLMHGYSNKKTLEKRLKSIYDSISIYDKPDLLVLGHIHTSAYREYGKTKVLQCASLMDNPPHVDKRYDNEKSCYFIHFVKDNTGKVIDIKIEQAFYDTEVKYKSVR